MDIEVRAEIDQDTGRGKVAFYAFIADSMEDSLNDLLGKAACITIASRYTQLFIVLTECIPYVEGRVFTQGIITYIPYMFKGDVVYSNLRYNM